MVPVLAVGALIIAGLGVWVRGLWLDALAPGLADGATLLIAWCATSALLGSGWLWLGMVLETIAHLQPARPTDRATSARPGPGARGIGRRWAHGLVAGTIGAGVATGTGAHAAAPMAGVTSILSAAGHSAPAATPAIPATPTAAGLVAPQPMASVSASDADQARSPGWRPSAPSVRPSPDPRFRPTTRAAEASADRADRVVVLRGDTLWSLAASRLGPSAGDTEIAAEWPRWYVANRAIIGEDPHLLRPGQELVVPERTARS